MYSKLDQTELLICQVLVPIHVFCSVVCPSLQQQQKRGWDSDVHDIIHTESSS